MLNAVSLKIELFQVKVRLLLIGRLGHLLYLEAVGDC